MRFRFTYRFNYFVPAGIALLLFFFCSFNSVFAQDEEEMTTDSTVIVLPPQESTNDFSSHYEEPAPQLRQVDDSAVNKLKRSKDFAYANDNSLKEEEEKAAVSGYRDPWRGFYDFFDSTLVKTIAYILVIGFLLFVIYRIVVVNNLFLAGRSKRLKEEEGEELEEEITPGNIDDKIRQAIDAKDYRSAIRYLYLKGLQVLDDKGWISYHAQATNHDYVYQVNKFPVAGDFRFLTQVYDYVWYGEFAVNDEQFTRLHSDFQRFYQAVK